MIKKLLQKKSNKNKDSNSNNGSKLTTKNRIKSFFHIGRKTVDHRSEIVDLDEFPNIELEKLKTDLKSSTIRDQANKWIDQLLDKGISGMETELNNLNKSKERINTAAFDANIDRNFNQKVICRDENRVILEGEENNYIHANYISTPNFTKHFICTQRPMETTTELFYKMLLQEQVVSIVMLCSLTENTEKNCPAYFPQKPTEKSMKFGCITVKCLNTEEMKNEPGIVVTALEIQDIDSQDLVVRHYYCRNWSERSFPDPACCIFTLLCAVRSSKKPIIVHCSDGVGRSGVFVALEYFLEKLQGESCIDAIELVKEIRNQRAMAIETPCQYMMLHRLLLQFFQELNIADMSQRLLEFIDDYDAYTKKHK